MLNIRFDKRELDRIHELVTKNQDDALTAPEKAELESYLRVSAFVDLMHAKARTFTQEAPLRFTGMDAALKQLVRQRAKRPMRILPPAAVRLRRAL